MKFLKIPETVLEVFKPLDNETKGKMFSALEAYERENKEPDFEGTEQALWISVKYLLKKKQPAKKAEKPEPIMQQTLPLAFLPAPKGGDPAEQETFRETEECAGTTVEEDTLQLKETSCAQFEPKSLGQILSGSKGLHIETISAEETISEPEAESDVIKNKEEATMEEAEFEEPEEGSYCPVEEPAGPTDEETAEKALLEEQAKELYLFYYNKWWDLKNAEADMVRYDFNENKEHICDWLAAMIKYHGAEKIKECILESSHDGYQISLGFRFDNIKNYFAKNFVA